VFLVLLSLTVHSLFFTIASASQKAGRIKK